MATVGSASATGSLLGLADDLLVLAGGGLSGTKVMLVPAGTLLPRGVQVVAAFPPTAVLAAGRRRVVRMVARAAGVPGNTVSDESFYIFVEQALSLLQVVTKLFLPDHFDVKLEGLKTRLVEVVSRAKVRDMEKFDLAVDLMRSAYAVLEVTSSPPREYYLVCEGPLPR